MNQPLIVLGIDVGMKRWAMSSEGLEKSFPFDGYNDFYNTVNHRVKELNPDLIVCGKPQGMNQNVKFAQGKLIGILNLIGERNCVAVAEINDSQARSIVYPGFGNKSKTVIQSLTNIADPDLSDAWVFRKAGETFEL